MDRINEEKLADALSLEHPCSGENTCDIAAAVRVRCYLWAARLLWGATECPETDKVLAAINEEMGARDFEAAIDDERVRFLDEVESIECAACGSYVYTDDDTATCGNCLAQVKREPEHLCAETRDACQPEGDHPNETPCSCSCHDEEK